MVLLGATVLDKRPEKQRHELTTEERRRGAHAATEAKRRKKREANACARELRAPSGRSTSTRTDTQAANATSRAAEREAKEAARPAPAPVPTWPWTHDDQRAYERTLSELCCLHGIYCMDCPYCGPPDEDELPPPQRGRYQSEEPAWTRISGGGDGRSGTTSKRFATASSSPIARMPEAAANDLVARMRKRKGGARYADQFLRIRCEHQTRSETNRGSHEDGP
jgi:hypothetical protein